MLSARRSESTTASTTSVRRSARNPVQPRPIGHRRRECLADWLADCHVFRRTGKSHRALGPSFNRLGSGRLRRWSSQRAYDMNPHYRSTLTSNGLQHRYVSCTQNSLQRARGTKGAEHCQQPRSGWLFRSGYNEANVPKLVGDG